MGYSPPEQYNLQQKLSPSTDIYALTATLYYLLTGNAPTPAPLRISQAVPQTLKFSSKKLKYLLPNLSANIEETIVRGLEIDPEKKIVSTALSEKYAYDDLVIATGSRARELKIP